MKVSEYRDLISEIWDLRNSFMSAATLEEKRSESARLARGLQELRNANCPRASFADKDRAARVEGMCAELLIQRISQK